MTCPSCGAPMRLEANQECLTCDYCRSIYFPEKNDDGVGVLGEAAESCPACSIPLMHATLARMRIRYCIRCRGVLVSMSVFTGLIEALKDEAESNVVPPPPDRRELERRLTCPQCHHSMDTHFYGGPGNIVIDDCSRCYLNWLDHGELMRIVRAPDREYGEEFGPNPRSFHSARR